MDGLLRVREKERAGLLKAEHFEPGVLPALKQQVFLDNKELRKVTDHLSDSQQANLLETVWLVSKERMLLKPTSWFGRRDETGAVREAIEQVVKPLYHDIESSGALVPRIRFTSRGREEVKASEAKRIEKQLAHLQRSITVEEMEQVFGRFSEGKRAREHEISSAKEAIKKGRWKLTNDHSGYVLEMEVNGLLYYLTDAQQNLKEVTLNELLT